MFAQKVAQEEAEEKKRRMTDEMVMLHMDRCGRLGLDSTTTPIVDPSCRFYLDALSVTWREINVDGNILEFSKLWVNYVVIGYS